MKSFGMTAPNHLKTGVEQTPETSCCQMRLRQWTCHGILIQPQTYGQAVTDPMITAQMFTFNVKNHHWTTS